MLETLLVVSGLLNAVLIGLKVVAPRTKTPLDDKVLSVLDKYGVPLVEYLQALYGPKAGNEPRPQVRDHRTK
jgi:hypothetical protein